MPAGRPKKSKQDKKSEIISVRLTKDQVATIISSYGSVKEFFKIVMDRMVKNV
jgi:hypothetical protein